MIKSKVVIFAVTHLTIYQLVQSQCINRILGETFLPNQLLLPNIVDYPLEILPNGQIINGQFLPGGQILSSPILNNVLPSQIMPSQIMPSVVPSPIVSGPVLPSILPSAAPTIIQDSTVANHLANTLQLLVVSNLLANKLPFNDVILPPTAPCSVGGYNMVY